MRPLLRLALGQQVNKSTTGTAQSMRLPQAKYWPTIKKPTPLQENTSFTRLRDPDGPRGVRSYGQSISLFANTKSEELELIERARTKDGIFVKKIPKWERSAGA